MGKMNKKILLTALVLFFVGSVVSAGNLFSFGTLQGTTEITGPEFYIGSIDEEELLINQKPQSCEEDPFSIAQEARSFKTKDLGNVTFDYLPTAEFQVRAKATANDDSVYPLTLEVEFGYDAIPVCSETITLDKGSADELNNYTIEANDCDAPQNAERLYYQFGKDDDCGNYDCDYSISKCVDTDDFYTKVKLSK